MPQDAITIRYHINELKNCLTQSKVVKITQPEQDEINFHLYTKFGNKKLVVSSNGNSPRFHLTDKSKQNPDRPPSFCMLLRKHLTNAIIKEVDTIEGDRVISIEFITKNELDDTVNCVLYIELMSRQSNIILVNASNKILGAIKQVSFDQNSRAVLGGVDYELPLNGDKISPYDEVLVKNLVDSYTEGNVANFLNASLSGFAFQTISEIIFRAFNTTEKFSLTSLEKKTLCDTIKDFLSMTKDNGLNPQVSYVNNTPKDFYFCDYTHLSYQTQPFETLDKAIYEFYTQKDNKERLNEHSKSLRTVIKNHISRNEKKLSAQLNQLKDCENMENEKIFGELITSNIYKIHKGMDKVDVENYYDDMKILTIKLDPTKNPSQNAQHFYKRYNKMKRTKEKVSIQIDDTKEHLIMLNSILGNLSTLTSADSIALIREDLYNSGLIKKPLAKKGKKVKQLKSAPLQYFYDGFTIFVGRNSTENEYVTHKLGKNKDMWLHAKSTFGAHILIKYEGRELTDDVIVFGAELAGFYSTANNSQKAEIDYTEVKNVKKPPSNKLGMVIYNTNYSMLAEPKDHIEFLKIGGSF